MCPDFVAMHIPSLQRLHAHVALGKHICPAVCPSSARVRFWPCSGTNAISLLALSVTLHSTYFLLDVPGTLCHATASFPVLVALQVFMFLFDKSGKLLHANQQALYHYCGASGMMHCCISVYNLFIDNTLYTACAFCPSLHSLPLLVQLR